MGQNLTYAKALRKLIAVPRCGAVRCRTQEKLPGDTLTK
jgi:hypothetical protein